MGGKVQTEIGQHQRTILVDWLLEVQRHFDIDYKDYVRAVKILDLYLSKGIVHKKDFQCLGCACLLLTDAQKTVDYINMADIAASSFDTEELFEMSCKLIDALGRGRNSGSCSHQGEDECNCMMLTEFEKPLTVLDYIFRRSDIKNSVGVMCIYVACIAIRTYDHLNVYQSVLSEICIDIAYSVMGLKNPEEFDSGNYHISELYKNIRKSVTTSDSAFPNIYELFWGPDTDE